MRWKAIQRQRTGSESMEGRRKGLSEGKTDKRIEETGGREERDERRKIPAVEQSGKEKRQTERTRQGRLVVESLTY